MYVSRYNKPATNVAVLPARTLGYYALGCDRSGHTTPTQTPPGDVNLVTMCSQQRIIVNLNINIIFGSAADILSWFGRPSSVHP